MHFLTIKNWQRYYRALRCVTDVSSCNAVLRHCQKKLASCSVPQLNTGSPSMCTRLYRYRCSPSGERIVRLFSITLPCRQPHPVFGECCDIFQLPLPCRQPAPHLRRMLFVQELTVAENNPHTTRQQLFTVLSVLA